MSSKGKDKSAYVEDEEVSAATAGSSEALSSSSYESESVVSEYPKRGKTRIPARLVSKRALIDLGYPYIEEGNTIIVLKALGHKNIDELLKLSEEYKHSELEIAAARSEPHEETYTIPPTAAIPRPGPIEVIAVDVEPGRPTSSTSGSARPSPTPQRYAPGPPPPTSTERQPTRGYKVPDRFRSASFGVAGRSQSGSQVLISGILPLNGTERTPATTQEVSGFSETQRAWNNPKSVMDEGTISTDLFDIHAAEYYMNQSGIHKVTLYCPNRPREQTTKASLVRMRWLHLQGVPSQLRALEDLVTDCPFVSQHLKSVALKVLMEVSQRARTSSEVGTGIEPGTMIRYIGRYASQFGRYQSDPTHDTEPVAFLSCPFLHLPETRNKQSGLEHTKTLLEFLYGYDAGSVQQTELGAHRVWLGEDAASRSFHAPNAWSLIVGSGK